MSRLDRRGHAPRLPSPKQHHQNARAAATAAAVIVYRGKGSNLEILGSSRTESKLTCIQHACKDPYTGVSFIEVVCVKPIGAEQG